MDLREIASLIYELEGIAKKLMEKGKDIQAIERNTKRILASIEMLKINIVDVSNLKV